MVWKELPANITATTDAKNQEKRLSDDKTNFHKRDRPHKITPVKATTATFQQRS